MSVKEEAPHQLCHLADITSLVNIAVFPLIAENIGQHLRASPPSALAPIIDRRVIIKDRLENPIGIGTFCHDRRIGNLHTAIAHRHGSHGIDKPAQMILLAHGIKTIPVEPMLLGRHQTGPVIDMPETDALQQEMGKRMPI